jgi:hypothetical protein
MPYQNYTITEYMSDQQTQQISFEVPANAPMYRWSYCGGLVTLTSVS